MVPNKRCNESILSYAAHLFQKINFSFTRKGGFFYVNQTVFDTTNDGCVINGFNALDQNGKNHIFISKINPDGTYAWGNEGKLFYDFGDKAISDAPCEAFVAADNEGGAWIAAGNGRETLVIARVNGDGDIVVKPIVFSTQDDNADGEKMIRRPQMFVGSDNSLFALLQYGIGIGGEGGTPKMINGHYDIVKIPADGDVAKISQNHLMDKDEIFNPGMRPMITEDGKGGAYVVTINGMAELHPYLYHFDSDANVSARGIDLFPSGSMSGVMAVYTAIDTKTSDLVVLIQDNQVDDYQCLYSFVNLQVADCNGNLKYDFDGENIFVTDNNDLIEYRMGYFVPTADGRFTFTFLLNVDKKSKFLYQSRINIDKGAMQDINEVVEIDEILSAGPSIDTRTQATDGFLRHIWYKMDGMYIYGYDVKVN